jgi:hypothetical protein
MNTEDKAVELVKKFMEYSYVGWHGGTDELTQEEAAKECALIAVAQVVEVLQDLNYKENGGRSDYDYFGAEEWEEVKEKIKLLK